MAFNPLPLGSVKPLGWLLGEMQTMASGLPGHMYGEGNDFYSYVTLSPWLNPNGSNTAEYASLNEALPYWFNGLVPLAYGLDDARLKGQVRAVADSVLGNQTADGWIGPEAGDKRNFWARTPFFLGLTGLAEAEAEVADKVVDGLRRFFGLARTMLQNGGQGFTACAEGIDCSWGQVRVHDLILTIQWLLEKHPTDDDSGLWDTMGMFYQQTNYKWDQWYTEGTFQQSVHMDAKDPNFPFNHGVNVGQGLKASAVIRRFTKDDGLLQKTSDGFNWTMQYHGSSTGSILADEIQRDNKPYLGSELCTAVETGFSLAYLTMALGGAEYADGAERVYYNAMPVMLSPDMWVHQYMSPPNMPFAAELDKSVFTTSNNVATMYELEPVLPCCTVNHPQGYPKLLSNSWATRGADGLAHLLLGPSRVRTAVAGRSVTVECDTAYPFGDLLHYTVVAMGDLTLLLRAPGWRDTDKTKVEVDGAEVAAPLDADTGMLAVRLAAGKHSVAYTVGMGPRTEARPASNATSVYVGSVLFSLDVGYDVSNNSAHMDSNPDGAPLTGLPFPQLRDETIRNVTAWNVAIDPATMRYRGAGDVTDVTGPFDPTAPPVFIEVVGCPVEWDMYEGVVPDVVPAPSACQGDQGTYRLIPHGAAKIHMAELPTMALGNSTSPPPKREVRVKRQHGSPRSHDHGHDHVH